MSHQTRTTECPDGGGYEKIPIPEDPAGACENGVVNHASSSSSSSSKGGIQDRMSAMTQHVGSLITSCCPDDPYHRKLAIGSIVCGLSCVGASALIYSVKAEHDVEKAQLYSDKAKCRAITSIILGVAIPILLVVLVILGSYLLTLID